MENAPELVEAEIKDVYNIGNENILASLTSAKRLSFLRSYMPLEIILLLASSIRRFLWSCI
ncbi:hypothetical protein Bca4012_082287 [Brassica carinata]